ncbi:probable G-protein coupled receptor 139 isoform X1 [Stegostoma tigrinum]|uniref:probable G-protein coupled receptor 139 isoform X1 n=1 Tax=Stegostoma tigrinum TaxID=3053191 RepID=UPI00287001F2|nr:probable G-protein coupled receptor 139 isoform X1 [Stegostoma tigrinum]
MSYPIVWQIEDVFYPLISAIGVPGQDLKMFTSTSMSFLTVNLVAILILSRGKCGLSECITHYLVGMAVADLLVVVFDAILWITIPIYLPHSFVKLTPVCSVLSALRSAATVISVWFTVTFTFDRFVAICYERLKAKFCTKTTAAAFLGTVTVLGCLESLPWYFAIEPRYFIDNIPWGCTHKQSYYSSPGWAAFEMVNYILTPCVPFFLILLFNVLTVRRILVSSQIRRGLHGQKSTEKHKDAEIENRFKSIILLFSISGSFVLLWVTQVVYNIYARIIDVRYYKSATDPCFIADRTAKMLQLLSSCTNTGIYAIIQVKFRQELKNAIIYPFNQIAQVWNRWRF